MAELEAAEGLLARAEQIAAEQPDRLLDALDDVLIEVSNASSESQLISQVHPDLPVREAAEEVVRQASSFATRFQQHRGIHEGLSKLDRSSLGEVDQRAIDLLVRDMERAGVGLPDPDRARVTELREELVERTQTFSRNIVEDVRSISIDPSALDGLPADYVAAHPPGADGKCVITTNYPDLQPFLMYSGDSGGRHRLMLEFHSQAVPANLEVLDRMLSVRHELARLLGYDSWAAYHLADKMVGSPAAAWDFITQAMGATRESAERELAQLLEAKRRDGGDGSVLNEWDLSYYTQKVKADTLDFDARDVRPYFEYGRVRQAILDLNEELFGLGFSRVDDDVWHPSVETFAVTADGHDAGFISLDMHPRDGKYKHAACFTKRVGVTGRQAPHPVLVCNFPDPAQGPALMEHSQVVTYFHEFGHLIHGVMSGQQGRRARIVRVDEWDFIEAPSQFLEEWIYDFDVLRRFARHIETDEVIPAELVDRLRAARDFGRAIQVQRQLLFSAYSLALHDRDPSGLDTTELYFELAREYAPYAVDPADRFQGSFGHLTGYSAAYYTYMWSLVIAKDLRTPFGEQLMDIPQAHRYRDLILAPGGSKPAAQLVEDYLGRPFRFDAFRDWLAGG